MNRKLTTALCMAALAFTVSGNSDAWAQKGAMFTPQGGWVTKDLASSKKGALPYCVAAKQFSKNTILTMAENKSGELSLAFDFGGGYFDPSRPAPVTLDPGAGQQRSFKVKPRSSKAIVIKLGRDDSFLDALARTGLLRMEVGEQSLNFNLADIDAGREKLGECLDGVIVVSAPNAVPPPNQDLRSMQVEGSDTYKNMQRAYENQIKALEEKLSQAKKTEEKAKQELTRVPSDRVPQAVGADGMPKSLPGLSAPTPIASTYTDKSKSDTKFDVLRKEYGQTKASLIAAQEKVSVLQAQLTKMKVERDLALESQQKISASTASAESAKIVQTLKEENTDLLARVKNLEEAYAQEIAASTKKYTDLDTNYQRAKLQLQQADKDVVSLKAQLAESEIKARQVAQSDLKAKAVDEKFAALLDEKNKVVALEAEKATLQNKVAELELDYQNQTTRVKSDYAQLRKTHDVALADLQRVSKESGELKAKLAKAESLQKQMETASLSEAQKLEQEFKDLLGEKERVVSVESENAALKSKITALEENLAHQKVSADERYDQLLKSYEAAKGTLDQTVQNVGALKKQLASVEVDKQKALVMQAEKSAPPSAEQIQELSDARQRIVTLEAENVSLKAQLESLQQNYDDDLSALRVSNSEKDQSLRLREIEVEAMRAEAERQLAQARDLRAGALSDSSSVVSTVSDVVSGAARAGGEAVSAVASMPRELPGLDDAAPVARAVVQAPRISHAATTAQALEQDVIASLRTLPPSTKAAPSVIDVEEEVSEVTSSLLESAEADLMSIPRAERLPIEKVAPPVIEEEIASDFSQEVEIPVMVEEVREPVRMRDPVLSYASDTIGQVLERAQISLVNDVQLVDAVSTPSYQAYEWRAERVFGSAEQRSAHTGSDFDSQVLSYLETTQERCVGDFAVEPSGSVGDGSSRVDSYEVACVGDRVSSAAALVFYNDGGKFTAVAHEASLDDMAVAMDMRDRIAKMLANKS